MTGIPCLNQQLCKCFFFKSKYVRFSIDWSTL